MIGAVHAGYGAGRRVCAASRVRVASPLVSPATRLPSHQALEPHLPRITPSYLIYTPLARLSRRQNYRPLRPHRILQEVGEA